MIKLFLMYTVPFKIQCWIRICKKNTSFHTKILRYKQINFDYEKIHLLKLVGCKNGWIFYWIFFSIWSIWKWIGSMHVDFFYFWPRPKIMEKTPPKKGLILAIFVQFFSIILGLGQKWKKSTGMEPIHFHIDHIEKKIQKNIQPFLRPINL